MRRLLYRAHQYAGLSAGLILMLVAVSGALLSYADNILRLLNPSVLQVSVSGTRLNPQQLIQVIQQQAQHKHIVGLNMLADPEAAAKVTFAPENKLPGRGSSEYVNPYSGQLLGKARGEDFLKTVENFHRQLLLGKTGKLLVGSCVLLLVLLLGSGLYLRRPRRRWGIKKWFLLRWHKLHGRAFIWQLHAVAGTWLLIFYLLSSLTGLYWSFDWYRSAVQHLVAVENQQTGTMPKRSPPLHMDEHLHQPGIPAEWNFAEHYQAIELSLVLHKTQMAWQERLLPVNAAHAKASDTRYTNLQGQLVQQDHYADKSPGQRFLSGMLAYHTGAFFGPLGTLLMFIASLCMPLFFISGCWLFIKRIRHQPRRRAPRVANKALQN